MTQFTHRTRLQVEALEDRITPSHFGALSPAAFIGLNVAAARFIPGEPLRPLAVAPVFALNYGSGSVTLPALHGLQNAFARLIPTEPTIPGNPVHVSPVFFGLANDSPVD
ncbi:MAG: hypothetical protein L0Z62_22435 [Gemmataceae bacterium]|nr:hypothetical protein [Gemmataceae bacterium]